MYSLVYCQVLCIRYMKNVADIVMLRQQWPISSLRCHAVLPIQQKDPENEDV